MNAQQQASLEDRIRVLKKELHHRQTEVALLLETGSAVSSEFNLERLLQMVAEKARHLLEAETVLIPILNEECAEYTYRAGCGKNSEEIVGETLPLELGVCGWVWQNKRPWWRGVLEELDEAERNKWEHEAGNLILVPLIGKDHFLGGIACMNKTSGQDFERRDLDLLTLFATQVSTAIENARLFEEIADAKIEAEAYQIQTQALNANLEKLVKKRTVDLEGANRELLQEISERKRVESELKRFTEKLEESNKELQEFAYVASHDLQEPLRKVTAFGDRLKTKCGEALSDQGRDYLERMQNAARRMQFLINGLLTYSRVTTKANPFSKVALDTVVEEVLSDLEIRIEQCGGRVDSENLAAVDADPLQMRQLMQNLIGNALKFHKKDEPPIVKIRGKSLNGNGANSQGQPPEGKLFQITIEDNGIGFDEKYADRIFGVFQRLHGRSEYEGTGIGLSVCRKIVERHGGQITAQSGPEKGATFIITLPFKQKEETEPNG